MTLDTKMFDVRIKLPGGMVDTKTVRANVFFIKDAAYVFRLAGEYAYACNVADTIDVKETDNGASQERALVQEKASDRERIEELESMLRGLHTEAFGDSPSPRLVFKTIYDDLISGLRTAKASRDMAMLARDLTQAIRKLHHNFFENDNLATPPMELLASLEDVLREAKKKP